MKLSKFSVLPHHPSLLPTIFGSTVSRDHDSKLDIFSNTSTKDRSKLFKECFKILSDLYSVGIYDITINGNPNSQNTLFSISEITQSNDSTTSPIVYEEALFSLKNAIGDKAKDQKRIMTPKKAFENGASSIVIGRSITKGNIRKNIDKLIKSLN